MTTNKRFDEQFGGLKYDGTDKPIKTFISSEKNLLLDQAIEEVELEQDIHSQCQETIISRLKELKE